MITSDIINLILQRYKMLCVKYPQSPSFIPNNKGDSFYLIRKRSGDLQPTQIRLSNHGTYLETWIDREELSESVERINPALCINISIVFVDEDEDLTNDCKGMPNCDGCEIEPCKPQTFEGQDELGRPFTVMQYVYNSKCIRRKYINGLTKAIMEASVGGKYVDPLVSLYRAAKEKELHSSTKTENKQYTTNTNMNKKLIRLNESDLHRIVKESVNKIINEIGDTPKGQLLPRKGWKTLATWMLNIEFNGELVYAIENHPENGEVLLLSNERDGYHVIGYFSDLEPSQQETIKNLLMQKMSGM